MNRESVADGEPRRPFKGKVAAPGGVLLALTHWPPPGDPRGMVLLVHGWGEHHRRYEEFAVALNDRGFSVCGFDLRGHGTSGGQRGHVKRFQDYTEDLVWVGEHAMALVAADTPMFVFGHSLGGLIVLRALQDGVVGPRAACVSAPWLGTLAPVPMWKRALARGLEWVLPRTPVPGKLDPTQLTSDPVKIEAHRSDPLIHAWMTPRLFREVERAQERTLGRSSEMALPTLFLVPGADPVVDANATTHYVARVGGPEAVLLPVPGSRHEPLNEVDREARFDEVGNFFEAHL